MFWLFDSSGLLVCWWLVDVFGLFDGQVLFWLFPMDVCYRFVYWWLRWKFACLIIACCLVSCVVRSYLRAYDLRFGVRGLLCLLFDCCCVCFLCFCYLLLCFDRFYLRCLINSWFWHFLFFDFVFYYLILDLFWCSVCCLWFCGVMFVCLATCCLDFCLLCDTLLVCFDFCFLFACLFWFCVGYLLSVFGFGLLNAWGCVCSSVIDFICCLLVFVYCVPCCSCFAVYGSLWLFCELFGLLLLCRMFGFC